jgi:hypothetical protein
MTYGLPLLLVLFRQAYSAPRDFNRDLQRIQSSSEYRIMIKTTKK